MKNFFLSILLSICVCGLLQAQNINPSPDPVYQDGIIYFKIDYNQGIAFKVNEDLSVDMSEFPSLKPIFEKYGFTSLTRPFYLFDNIDLLHTLRGEFSNFKDIDLLIKDLEQKDIILLAEKVPLHKIYWVPNDPYYNSYSDLRWHLNLIKADSAWDVQTGSSHIKVAIIDNFIWGDHPDLQIASSNQCKFTSSNKYTVGSSAPLSSSIPQGSTQAAYSASHGTHCAGLVGAINNNGIGIASIGGGVTLLSVASGVESNPKYIQYGNESIQWAANKGANVISMSYGTSASSSTGRTIMQACYNAGIVLVAAAGNEGNKDNNISYPAGYSTVISVASVDGDGKLSSFSQWGSGRADIAAPGGYIKSGYYPNIFSTTYCKSYLFPSLYSGSFSGIYYDGMEGTSMACPIVAGLCGLLLSKDSTLTPAQILARLQETATPLHKASSHTIDGNGYINAYAALGYSYIRVSDTALLFSSNANQSKTITIESTVNWTITNIPSWLDVTPSSGLSGTTQVTIATNNENNGSTVLTSQLSVISDDANPKYLTVNQVNYELNIEISPKHTLLSGNKGSLDTLYIETNLPWEIINDNNWLALSKTSGTGNDTVIFSAKSANTWSSNRTGLLIVKTLNFREDTAIIEQRLPDFIKVSSSLELLSPYSGSSATIDVYANVNWTVTGDEDWIHVNKQNGVDSTQLIFTTLSDNTTKSPRNATFTVSNGSISRNIIITQQDDVSIDEAEQENTWNIFPNPVSNSLNIHIENIDVKSIEILDVVGKNITTLYLPQSKTSLNVSAYSSGIYTIKLTTHTHQIFYKKFIKQ